MGLEQDGAGFSSQLGALLRASARERSARPGAPMQNTPSFPQPPWPVAAPQPPPALAPNAAPPRRTSKVPFRFGLGAALLSLAAVVGVWQIAVGEDVAIYNDGETRASVDVEGKKTHDSSPTAGGR